MGTHDFSAHTAASLAPADADWDFKRALNPVSNTVLVTLEIQPALLTQSQVPPTEWQTWQQRRHRVLASARTAREHGASLISNLVPETEMERPLAVGCSSTERSPRPSKLGRQSNRSEAGQKKQHERHLRRLQERAFKSRLSCPQTNL